MMKKGVIASGLCRDACNFLAERAIDVISFSANPSLDGRVAHHADLSFFYDGRDTVYLSAEMSAYRHILEDYCKNVILLSDKLGNAYPFDVPLNCVVVGNNLICNEKTVSREIFDNMENIGYNIINVNQGYTKCSVVPVDDNSIITDDESVFRKCTEVGIEVLLVSKGAVKLAGFDYGFIGGTCGKISESEIIFNGDLRKHPDYEKICTFLSSHERNAVYFDGELEDIGSIIPLY